METFLWQAEGRVPPCFVSTILDDEGDRMLPQNLLDLKWTTAIIYGAGSDTAGLS